MTPPNTDQAFGLPLTTADRAALKAKRGRQGFHVEVWTDPNIAPDVVGLIPRRSQHVSNLVEQGVATWIIWRQADGDQLQVDSLIDARTWTVPTMQDALDSVAGANQQ